MTRVLHVSTHAKAHNTVEVRLFMAAGGNPRHRIGTLNVPRLAWDGWLLRLLHAGALACGATITIDAP